VSYEIAIPVLRHVLQAVGGFLVASGWIDESMADTFIGLGINAGAFAWWAVEKWLSKRETPFFGRSGG
jgi:hypothetical protein